MAPSSNVLLAAVVAAAAGSALLFAKLDVLPLLKSNVGSEDPSSLSEEEECISSDDIVQIFDALFMHMQSVLAQLSQQIQQIQMSGQTISEPQLRQLLKAEFERALISQQAVVFEEFDMDEDCVREATWEFLKAGDEFPKVKKSVVRFQKLYENITGESVVGIFPGEDKLVRSAAAANDEIKEVEMISKEKLLEAASTYFEALTSSMEDVVKRFKAEGKDLRDTAMAQKMHMQFAAVANDVGEEALQGIGVTLDGFRAAIQKYSDSPDVGRALTMLQMRQQQDLIAMGVPPM